MQMQQLIDTTRGMTLRISRRQWEELRTAKKQSDDILEATSFKRIKRHVFAQADWHFLFQN